ncbi:hypothetical protein HN51_026201 [Arachis hypogaea]
MKKQTPVNIQPQDTSVEPLIREVTSEKFWHHPVWILEELNKSPGERENIEWILEELNNFNLVWP